MGSRRSRVSRPQTILALTLAFVLACRGSEPLQGWFRAEVTSHDGFPIYFLLWVPDGNGKARFHSGGYQFEADATRDDDVLRIGFPVYNSELTARRAGTRFVGRMALFTPFGGRVELPFSASPVAAGSLDQLRPPQIAGAQLQLGAATTFWRLRFAEGGLGKLTLREVASGAIQATLVRDSGDQTDLGGFATHTGIVLSGFDGAAAFRLDLALEPDGQRGRGAWLSGQALDWRQDLHVERADDFALTPRGALVPVGTHIDAPQLALHAGKPVVVEIGASWCTTCEALTPTLIELYREFHPRGLEMVTLLYELSDDVAYCTAQASKFKQAYGIPWPVIAVPGEVDATQIPGQAQQTTFPVVLFLSSTHDLVAGHVGFPMRDDDPERTALLASFRTHVEAILQSQ